MAEVERLLDAARSWEGRLRAIPAPLRDRALLEFLYGTGARISEAVGAGRGRPRHWTLSRPCCSHGKGGKQRIVPVGGYAAAALDAYLVRGRPALAAGAARGQARAGRPPGPQRRRCS